MEKLKKNIARNQSLCRLLRSDVKRYIDKDEFNFIDVLSAVLREECLQYIISFRLSQKIICLRNPLIRIPLKVFLVSFLHRTISIILGIHINLKAIIGEGFYIGHPGMIFIGPTKLGRYCNISHEVTIGIGNSDEKEGIPIIGDMVYIGPGAKLFGKIEVGNFASIGANAVVTKTIRDGVIIVGNPGRIVGHQEKNKQIQNIEQKKYIGFLPAMRALIYGKIRPSTCENKVVNKSDSY